MNGDFQHIHFLTTRTMINEISNMSSLIFPSVIQIRETFKGTSKSIMANNCVVEHADFAALHAQGLDDEDAWDIAAITAFFGLSNRMASFSGMVPNPEFYLMGRVPKPKT